VAWQLQQGVGTLAHPFYTGVSSDDKPALDVPDATAFELDTRREYIWRRNAWYLFREPQNLLTVLNELVQQQKRTVEQLEILIDKFK
jgi:hypothetical protein